MLRTGCVFAELVTGRPLLPGEDDVDALCWVLAVVGGGGGSPRATAGSAAGPRPGLSAQQEAVLQLLPADARAKLDAARARGPLLDG